MKEKRVRQKKKKFRNKSEDPYSQIRRDIPPTGYVIGSKKYDRKRVKELIEKELENFHEEE